MKKPKRKKPKFRVGQVVALCPPYQRSYLRIHRGELIAGSKWKYAADGSPELVWWEYELRPLTAKEKGPKK